MTDYNLIKQALTVWEPGQHKEGGLHGYTERAFLACTIQRILKEHGRRIRFMDARALLRRLQEDGLLSESYEPVRTAESEREDSSGECEIPGQTTIFDYLEAEE